jgi:hypothetical protein
MSQNGQFLWRKLEGSKPGSSINYVYFMGPDEQKASIRDFLRMASSPTFELYPRQVQLFQLVRREFKLEATTLSGDELAVYDDTRPFAEILEDLCVLAGFRRGVERKLRYREYLVGTPDCAPWALTAVSLDRRLEEDGPAPPPGPAVEPAGSARQ